MTQVLVLNQDYTPLSLCSAERAFTLIFLRKADLVSENEDRKIRTVNEAYPFPSVIKLNRYVVAPYKGVVLSRSNIFKRDNFACQYCGTDQDLTLDHLIPKSKGGKSTWTNLVTACKRCNAKKGDSDIDKIDMELQNRPVKPSYILFLKSKAGQTRSDWYPYLIKKSV